MLPARIGGYEVTGELGRGGMGVVYRGRDPRDGRPVAIKLLLGGRGAGADARRRFEREVQALVRLRHPGLVRVLDAGEEQGCPFLVVELVEGGTLAQRLARSGPLPADEATALAVRLAGALGHAHAQGVVHRDVKPANVLLGPDGPKLTDFGLAKDFDPSRSRLSQTGCFLGSPGYMAPEQAAGEHARVDARTDVHGLGATLYAALTGEPPIRGESLQELLIATADRPVDPPSRLQPGVSARLDAVCARCLAKAPDERFASAAEVAEALSAAPLERRRRGGVVALSGGALLLVVVALGLAWRPTREAPASPPVEAAPRPAEVPPSGAPVGSSAAARTYGEVAIPPPADRTPGRTAVTWVWFVDDRHVITRTRWSSSLSLWQLDGRGARQTGTTQLPTSTSAYAAAVLQDGARRTVLVAHVQTILAIDLLDDGAGGLSLAPAREWGRVPDDARPTAGPRPRGGLALTVDPDGLVAVGGDWTHVFLLRADGRSPARIEGELAQGVRSLAFTTDGEHLLVGVGSTVARAAELRVWSLRDRVWRGGHSVPATIVKLAQDGRGTFAAAISAPVTGVEDDEAPAAAVPTALVGALDQLYDPLSPSAFRLLGPDSASRGSGRGAAFLPDGDLLTLRSSGADELQRWEARAWAPRASPRFAECAGDRLPFSLDVSPDGGWIAVGWAEGGASVWRTEELFGR